MCVCVHQQVFTILSCLSSSHASVSHIHTSTCVYVCTSSTPSRSLLPCSSLHHHLPRPPFLSANSPCQIYMYALNTGNKHTNIYICTYLSCENIHIYAHTYDVCVCIYTYMYICVCIYTYMYIYIFNMCVCIHIYMYVYIYTCICIFTQVDAAATTGYENIA